ncbi:hypothetical protein Tco_1297880 [Tanacetum coccineum]
MSLGICFPIELSLGNRWGKSVMDFLPASIICKVSMLKGKRIRGCFYGWVILSNNVTWSLWNPVTGKTICLPPLVLNDGDCDDISHCCLSSPPNNPSSILLLTRATKPTFVFCRLDRKRKRLRWTEMSYVKQLKRISDDGSLIHSLASCNGKVFALNTDGNFANFVIHLDIAVKVREVVIKLASFWACPFGNPPTSHDRFFLKEYGSILFCIVMAYNEEAKKTLVFVSLYKLDTTSIKWEELECPKDWDMANKNWEGIDAGYLVTCLKLTRFALELAGHIHIRGETGNMIHSCHVKDKTISISSMHSQVLPTSYVSLWECRLDGDNVDPKLEDKDGEIVVRRIRDDDDGVEHLSEPHLLNLPLHYAAPSKEWSDYSALRRMQNYSLVSPSWLMVVDRTQCIFTFIDPMSGEKFFMNTSDLPIDVDIKCVKSSRFGWLLCYCYIGTTTTLVFYNPFTSDIRELPYIHIHYSYIDGSFCFSAPPTSPDCIVVSLAEEGNEVCIHFVGGESSWRTIYLSDLFSFRFPTFLGRDLYALCNEGELHVLKNLDLGLSGESVEVFKMNDSTKEWEKVDSLGSHMIYISSTTCMCLEAKSRHMENKIYFPQLHSKNNMIVFYSLETCKYDTFVPMGSEENFGRKSYYPT